MTDFAEKIVLLVIDKGVLGLILLAFGLFINIRIEQFRTDQQRLLALQRDKAALENELGKARLSAQTVFREKQLSQFYWPIKMRLEKDGAMWPHIKHLTDGVGKLPLDLGKRIELDFLRKNHLEIVDIIEKNIHLAEASPELLSDLVAYIKHVAVYKALRDSNNYSFNPLSLDAPFPPKLVERIEARISVLQPEYDQFAMLDKNARGEELPSAEPIHAA